MIDGNLVGPFIAGAMQLARVNEWIPEGPGKWSLPVNFLPDHEGWVELMRLRPGVRVSLHRHTGEVHALNLQGTRRLADGRVIGPGQYVYEPPGNVDWWEATGDCDLIVFVVVKGSVEYLAEDHSVSRQITTSTRVIDYQAHLGHRPGNQAGEPTA